MNRSRQHLLRTPFLTPCEEIGAKTMILPPISRISPEAQCLKKERRHI